MNTLLSKQFRYQIHLSFAFVLMMLAACEKNAPESGPAAAPPPPQVTVALPLVKDVTDWDEFTGRLYAIESVEVRPRVSGYLQSVNFEEGSLVEAGDLLYVIDPRPYQAILDQSKAELSRSKAALELAENDLARAEKLYKSRAISEEELDSRGSQKRAAMASLESTMAAINAAKLNVEFTHIKAPISGRISRTLVTKGNLVTGGDFDSSLLTTIVSLDPIYVYFTADEQAVLHYTRMDMAGTRKSSRMTPNPVLLRLADEEEYLHQGKMDFVDNQIDRATGTMRGRAIVDNPEYLLIPGMFADVKLLGEGPYEALLIPDSAISVDQTIRFVYVLGENNTVERRQIKPGKLKDGLRVIRSGLNKEDRVIINGIQRVRAGVQVSPETSTIAVSINQQG
ncbi:MAG: MexE family multidrug efflux RND transporter periplasmic adaptor subunit [marine bacterium B5-7]|nr:MAG: MexE family multidrug efflux RND transporter periplasmic adaptor subunit [marine bacterium B5-7]